MTRVRHHCHNCQVSSFEPLCWVCQCPMQSKGATAEPGKGLAFASADEAHSAFEVQVHWADGVSESL